MKQNMFVFIVLVVCLLLIGVFIIPAINDGVSIIGADARKPKMDIIITERFYVGEMPCMWIINASKGYEGITCDWSKGSKPAQRQ